jgi:hypothetical protein
MENGLFEEALDSAIRNADSLRDNSVLEVGKRLISHLIERQDFETAAGYLPDVFIFPKSSTNLFSPIPVRSAPNARRNGCST